MCNCASDPNHDPARCECSCHYKQVPSISSIRPVVRTELSSAECQLLHSTLAEEAQRIERALPALAVGCREGVYENAKEHMDKLRALAELLLFARVWVSSSERVKR